MSLIIPCKLAIRNFVLIPNLGCYLPILPILQAFALAIFSVCYPSTGNLSSYISAYEDEIRNVLQRRSLLIAKLVICSLIIITIMLIYQYKHVLKSCVCRKSDLVVKNRENTSCEGFHSGDTTTIEDTCNATKAEVPDDVIHDPFAEEESPSMEENCSEITTASLQFGRIDTCNDYKKAATEEYEAVTNSETMSRPITFQVSEDSESGSKAETVVNTCLSDEDSTLSEISDHILVFDDSGVGFSRTEPGSLVDLVEDVSSRKTSYDMHKTQSGLGKDTLFDPMTSPKRTQLRRSSFTIGKDVDLLEVERVARETTDDLGSSIERNETEDILVRQKTELAVSALSDIFKECGNIEWGLGKLGDKNNKVRSKLEKILLNIEETDV